MPLGFDSRITRVSRVFNGGDRLIPAAASFVLKGDAHVEKVGE